MKILALITARGGSKRLPNKNTRLLGGKPLIVWTIEAARGASDFVDILVSTDSTEIANVSMSAGALVPWLRPEELATDSASSMSVCMHALDWYEKEKGQVDGLMLLQPTSPFRSIDTIRCAIKLFVGHPQGAVVSFSEAQSHPMWCYSIKDQNISPFISCENRPSRSQDLPKAYAVNGAVYIASPRYLRKNGSFIGRDTTPLIMCSTTEILDIDTEWDWIMAESIVNRCL